VAPAMNVEMWQNPATQRNAARLRDDGIALLGPAAGEQACGETGLGRMLEPAELVEDIVAALRPKPLAGRRVLMTAGPTFEPIDPVRGITNLSSGKMGYAIARAAREAGADVTMISGPTALAAPRGVRRIDVRTARERADAVLAPLGQFTRTGGCDVVIGVAAVADWRVANASAAKLKKTGNGAMPPLAFEQNPDILAAVAALPDAPYCVGFAAESGDLIAEGEAKRRRKNVPLLVGNIAHRTFGRDDNELVLFDEHGHRALPPGDKLTLARLLVDEIARQIARRFPPRSAALHTNA
ncbi:MAG: bifunctional phosphopantothenoylcysteine decarboxylase/phosphopantothenate--cysteine ligase CoaBC, partial [Burkholderiaceae bacterium]